MAKNQLQQLLIYRNILEDSIIQKILQLLEGNGSEQLPYQLYSELITKAEQLNLSGDIVKKYLLYLVSKDENVFSKMAEKMQGNMPQHCSLYQAAVHDISIIKEFIASDVKAIYEMAALPFIGNFVSTASTDTLAYQPVFDSCFAGAVEIDTTAAVVEQLSKYYAQYGSGEMAQFTTFRWNQHTGLSGIKNSDTITLQDITGYERQKEVLVKNTCSFIENKPANNILLTGSPGTGKSSSVKALINAEFAKNLRLVEVSKYELNSLSQLLNLLSGYCQKFIIFLDDLSFEEFESQYKYLKSIIDGGIEVKPTNVLIYATSNRVHLIKENWDDRKGSSEEVHRFDTLNEKISLAGRFGITLSYFSPNQVEYLAIIEQLAIKNEIPLPLEEVKIASLQWEREHNGRSGRTAQQFINHLLSQQ